MMITREYVEVRRQKAFGNTVYRCPTCGFEAFGAPVFYHEMLTDHAAMLPLERFVGQEIDTVVNGATR